MKYFWAFEKKRDTTFWYLCMCKKEEDLKGLGLSLVVFDKSWCWVTAMFAYIAVWSQRGHPLKLFRYKYICETKLKNAL